MMIALTVDGAQLDAYLNILVGNYCNYMRLI